MNGSYLVRVGAMGLIGRFRAIDGARYARGTHVVCRTVRGIEVGHVLTATDSDQLDDGAVLRRMTVSDELLLVRVEKNRQQAFEACQRLIQRQGLDAVLLDVEHLFDGQSLFFYFLGEVPVELERLTQELAETYDAEVQFRQFTDALIRGCGPDCGTAQATGCGTSGCATCAAATQCRTK